MPGCLYFPILELVKIINIADRWCCIDIFLYNRIYFFDIILCQRTIWISLCIFNSDDLFIEQLAENMTLLTFLRQGCQIFHIVVHLLTAKKYFEQHLRPHDAMYGFFWPHSDRADRKLLLRRDLRLARVTSGDPRNNHPCIALVSECASIDNRNAEANANLIDIISKIFPLQKYLASILSSAITRKSNSLKNSTANSLIFLWWASMLRNGLICLIVSFATKAFDWPLCSLLNKNCRLRFDSYNYAHDST